VVKETTGADIAGTTAEVALPLGEVVGRVKAWVERCGWIWVEAQIIEIRRRQAPTQFLTLRDLSSNVSATITCTAAVIEAAGLITEGTQVLARLTPRIYAERADLSFECSELQVAGEGRLLAQLEALKRKLQAEGLFDPLKKLKLPFLPRAIGLITGAGSAAERDVLTNSRLRWPAVNFVIKHALMQGPSSAAEVMTALAELAADGLVDLIVIARGGGSLEDLLPFSDEGLIRAVAAVKIPVVSAIGHEPDMPLLDLVADLRASTPTDAAKQIVPNVAEESRALVGLRQRLRRILAGHLQIELAWLNQIQRRPVLKQAAAAIEPHLTQVAGLKAQLRQVWRRRLSEAQRGLSEALMRVRAMSPEATLRRGYAIATVDGELLTSRNQVVVGQRVELTLADGGLTTEVLDLKSKVAIQVREKQ